MIALSFQMYLSQPNLCVAQRAAVSAVVAVGTIGDGEDSRSRLIDEIIPATYRADSRGNYPRKTAGSSVDR